MKQQIKVGSIIEILNHDAEAFGAIEAKNFPVGSRHAVVEFHQETGEVEVLWYEYEQGSETMTFFPGEYNLVE